MTPRLRAVPDADCPHERHPCHTLFHEQQALGKASWDTRCGLYAISWRIGPAGLVCYRPTIAALKEAAGAYLDLLRPESVRPVPLTLARVAVVV